MKRLLYLTSYPVISTNGAHLSAFERLVSLQKKGHSVKLVSLVSDRNEALFYNIVSSWPKRFNNISREKNRLIFNYDSLMIETIFLARPEEIAQAVDMLNSSFQPDTAFIGIRDKRVWQAWQKYHKPYIIFFHDHEFPRQETSDTEQKELIQNAAFVFTSSEFLQSEFTKDWHQEAGLVYPLIPPEKHKITENSKQYITFINPVPVKGVEVFLAIASVMTDKKFLVVGGWTQEDRDKFKLVLPAYNNIEYLDPVDDIRVVLEKTRILLVPSLWEEAFGRIVIEAFINGIPVLANNSGELSKTVGQGSFVLPYDKKNHLRYINLWVEKIRQLDADPLFYEEVSKAAMLQAEKHTALSRQTFDKFEQIIVGL